MVFGSAAQWAVWLGLLCVCALSMITRPIFSDALDDTPLDNLSPVEVIVVCLCMGGIGLWVGQSRPAGTPGGMRRLEWGLVGFALTTTVAYALSFMVPPTSDYDLIFAFVMYRNIMASTVVGYGFARLAVNTARKALVPMRVLMAVAILIAGAVLAGKAVPSVGRLAEEGASYGQIALPLGMGISIGGNTGALYLLCFIYLGFSFLLAGSKSISGRILYGAAFAVMALAVVIIACRAVILVAPLGCVLIWLLAVRERTGRRRRIVLWTVPPVLFAVGCAAIAGSWDSILASLNAFQSAKLGTLAEGFGVLDQGTLVARLEQYPAYLDTILYHPLGYGILSRYPQHRISQPHGLILKLFVTSGWLGVLSYLSFILWMTWFWFRRLPYVEPAARALLRGMIAVNVSFIALGWGYDLLFRFHIQLTYFLLCGLATAVAVHAPSTARPARHLPRGEQEIVFAPRGPA